MKFNFKKVASVIASAVMITSTVGFAAASTYPDPFTSGSAIVYGSAAAASDIAAAISISNNLNSKVTVSSTTSSGATASGGDNVNLATSSQNLFYGSALNSAKTTLTKTELPSLLADGTLTDSAGNAYTYSQSITLGGRNITYGTAGGNLQDPALYIDGGTSTTSPLYTYKLTLNKVVNVTSSDVIGNDITILGNKFTIGAGSSNTTLLLYGSGQQTNINEGDSADVTIGDAKHTIKVTGITQSGSTNQVYVSIDGGAAQKISEGSSVNLGGIQIYAKTVFYSGKTGSTNYASLNLGASVLELDDGQAVLIGTDKTSIQNTKATLVSGTSGKVSSIQLAIAMQDSIKNYILAGGSFVDPVFGGLSVQFADTNPTLDSTARDAVSVDSDGSRNLRATFTSALAGKSATLSFLHDFRSDTGTGNPTLVLADTANKTIHVVEGEGIAVSEYMMINSGDYGRIIKLTTSIPSTLTTSSTIQFQDALTGDNIFSGSGLTVAPSGGTTVISNTTTNVDGQPYYFQVNATAGTVKITWGANANYGLVGDQTTVSPKIKLMNGEWISFLEPITLTNASSYVLPGLDTLTTYETGAAIICPQTTAAATTTKTFGNVVYNITNIGNTTCLLNGISTDATGVVNANFNSTLGGAVLIQEPKKTTESSDSTDGDIIVIGSGTEGTPVTVNVATPVYSHTSKYGSSLISWTSNSNLQTAVDRYGSLISKDSTNNNKVTVSVPNQQMIADVLFTSTGATITPGSSSGGSSGASTVSIVTDKDVGDGSAYANKNLIVIGGSCINTVALKIINPTATLPLCGNDFTTATKVGSNQYLIQTVANPYAATGSGKIAMLVAGYEAADTTNAAKLVLTGVDTTVGKSQVYPIVAANA